LVRCVLVILRCPRGDRAFVEYSARQPQTKSAQVADFRCKSLVKI
jgi:hypothetical protein